MVDTWPGSMGFARRAGTDKEEERVGGGPHRFSLNDLLLSDPTAGISVGLSRTLEPSTALGRGALPVGTRLLSLGSK